MSEAQIDATQPWTMTNAPIKIRRISRNKFEVLAGMTRRPEMMFLVDELEHYSDEPENYLGVVLTDHVDHDFSALALARDEFGKYCCFNITTSYKTIEEARSWLERVMKWESGSGKTIQEQGHDSQPTLDIFKPIVPREKQHIYFQRLHSNPAFIGARKVISEMMPHFVDIDGNFVQQFQSDGFDSRLWELYIFAVLKESGFNIDRSFHAPDFVGSCFGIDLAVEAVIVGRKAGVNPSALQAVPELPAPEDTWTRLKDEMPIRFGSPLFSKLQKKYWDLGHVKGKPLAIAIADFHDDQSMIWSHSALYPYLYGIRYEVEKGKDGNLIKKTIKLDSHSHDGKTIPSGFFLQPESENISAVITSASGTVSKFNRMARQAGYGSPAIKMIRIGYCFNQDPDALLPNIFEYEVNESCDELWSTGLNVFHNPKAKVPLDPKTFPYAGHFFLRGEAVVSLLPPFHPFSSWTIDLIPKGMDLGQGGAKIITP